MDATAIDKPCDVYVVHVGNKALRNAETPTVFLSGALHGDERVGSVYVHVRVCLCMYMYIYHTYLCIRLHICMYNMYTYTCIHV